MGILIDRDARVIIQGITGREGSLRARYMREYGTNVVAGTSPGKGGQAVEGVPVFHTAHEAVEVCGRVDFSVIFIPGRVLLPAVKEAADAGVANVVCCVESVPVHDSMAMIEYCAERGTRILGPGSIGAITPGEAVVGWLGGSLEWANAFFAPGPVGVLSRSGGQSGTIPWVLRRAGLGVSTAVDTAGATPPASSSVRARKPAIIRPTPQTRTAMTPSTTTEEISRSDEIQRGRRTGIAWAAATVTGRADANRRSCRTSTYCSRMASGLSPRKSA